MHSPSLKTGYYCFIFNLQDMYKTLPPRAFISHVHAPVAVGYHSLAVTHCLQKWCWDPIELIELVVSSFSMVSCSPLHELCSMSWN